MWCYKHVYRKASVEKGFYGFLEMFLIGIVLRLVPLNVGIYINYNFD